jgi:hypothetical protein
LVAVAFSNFPSAKTDWLIFGLLVLAVILTQIFQVNGINGHAYYPDSVFFIAGVFLLGPAQFALLVIVPHLTEWLQVRLTRNARLKDWYSQPFNIATHLLAGFSALLIQELLDDLLDSPGRLLGILLIALAYVLVNHILIAGLLRLARGQSISGSGLFKLDSLLPDLVMACLGYVVAILWRLDFWLIFPALTPLALMF